MLANLFNSDEGRLGLSLGWLGGIFCRGGVIGDELRDYVNGDREHNCAVVLC